MEAAEIRLTESPYKDLLGTTASITTIGQFLSGVFTVRRILAAGTTGDLSPVPFIMGVVGCALWLLYGHLKNDPTVVQCNVIGTVLNAIYVVFFVRYTVIKSLIYRQVVSSITFLVLVWVFVRTSSTPSLIESTTDTLGILCVAVSIVGCASPLVALKEVMRTRSTDMLPFPLILSMFLVCTQWWGYGVLTGDFYMQFTNFLGTCIALVQLSLFVIYPSGKGRHHDNQQAAYSKINA